MSEMGVRGRAPAGCGAEPREEKFADFALNLVSESLCISTREVSFLRFHDRHMVCLEPIEPKMSS